MSKEIYVIFDGPEGGGLPVSADGDQPHVRRFVILADADGEAITMPLEPWKNGFWRLGPFVDFVPVMPSPESLDHNHNRNDGWTSGCPVCNPEEAQGNLTKCGVPVVDLLGGDMNLKEAESKIERLIEKGDAMMRAGDEHGALDENDRAFMETVHAWDKAKR